jgi:hypothetical protein
LFIIFCQEVQKKGQNIDVNETEVKKLRDEQIKGLIIPAKAKWQVEGEKSTNYFCNLEKHYFTEKLIPKLIVENNEKIF